MNKLQQIINYKWFPYVFFILAISISVFQHYRIFSLDFIGYHTWRQTQTQTVIENFAFEDFNILNPRLNDFGTPDRIYRMEFPLCQWLIACLYKIFGNHIIITRLFFFITTLVSSFGIYRLILKLTKQKIIAMLIFWFFMFAPIIYYYSINPIPDNLALCLGIWAIFYWVNFLQTENKTYFLISCLFLALSIAIKLPFIVFGGIYLSKFIDFENYKKINLRFFIIPFLITLPAFIWYFSVIGTWQGNNVVIGMFGNQTSLLNLLDILQFNLISTLPELLINYATFPLFIIGGYYVIKNINYKNRIHFSFISVGALCILYFLFELNMIDKVHDYYLFPFLPLLFIIIGFGLHKIFEVKSSKWKYLVILSFVICPVTAYLRCNTRWNLYKPGFEKEYLLSKNILQQTIKKTEKIIVYGDDSKSIVLYFLNRKGWSYYENNITQKNFLDNIKHGAHYFITDCNIDTSSVIQTHLSELIYKKGNLQLYKLK